MSTLNIDGINRKAWSTRQALKIYDTSYGYTDPGEKAAIERVTAEARGRPILDIGVGAGRSAQLWTAISKDGYVGVDYCPEILALAKAKFPDTRFLQMDARDLSAFPSNSFFLTTFSFNGIDSVDYEGRLKVLAEVNRVLMPGGVFVFSSHNKDGPGSRETLRMLRPGFTRNPAEMALRTFRSLRATPHSIINFYRNKRLHQDHGTYSIKTCSAHNFGIVIMYTTLAEQKRQLAAAGFKIEAIYDNFRGQPVSDSSDLRAAHWFQFVARKL